MYITQCLTAKSKEKNIANKISAHDAFLE